MSKRQLISYESHLRLLRHVVLLCVGGWLDRGAGRPVAWGGALSNGERIIANTPTEPYEDACHGCPTFSELKEQFHAFENGA